MPSLDTNVLIRYLVADDPSQFEAAKAHIDEITPDDSLFIPLSVSVELEWVLRTVYEFDKSTVLKILNQLLETREVEFQDEPSIEVSLNLYSEGNADYVGCLHCATAYYNDRSPLVTFDRKSARLPEAQLLEKA